MGLKSKKRTVYSPGSQKIRHQTLRVPQKFQISSSERRKHRQPNRKMGKTGSFVADSRWTDCCNKSVWENRNCWTWWQRPSTTLNRLIINKLLQAIPMTKKQRPENLHLPESQPEVFDIDNEDVVNTVEDDVAPENEPSYETGPTNKLNEAGESYLWRKQIKFNKNNGKKCPIFTHPKK